MLFVNGLLTDTSSWARHLPHFVGRYRCLLYDCRGQGQSAKPDHPYTTAHHAADLAALLEGLAIEGAHVVGLSNGGAAALHVAAEQPHRVQSLVVSGAYATVDSLLRAKLTSWVRAMEAGGSPLRFDVATPWVWGGAFLDEHYDTLLAFREKGVNLPIQHAMNLIQGAMQHDVRAALPRVQAPTLAVVGEEDVLTPPALSRQIAEQVPHGRLHIMPGRGHAAALEDVPAFCQIVLDFLREVERD